MRLALTLLLLFAAAPVLHADCALPADVHQTSPPAETDEFDDASIDGKWSWVNQGSATIVEQEGYEQLGVPASATDNWRWRIQTAPSTPYTLRARMWIDMAYGSYAEGGIALRRTANSKSLFCGFETTSTWFTAFGANTSDTATTTDVATLSQIPFIAVQYYEFSNDGTTITCKASVDGVLFHTVGTQAVATFLGGAPDQIGFGGNSHNSAAVTLNVYWFRKS